MPSRLLFSSSNCSCRVQFKGLSLWRCLQQDFGTVLMLTTFRLLVCCCGWNWLGQQVTSESTVLCARFSFTNNIPRHGHHPSGKLETPAFFSRISPFTYYFHLMLLTTWNSIFLHDFSCYYYVEWIETDTIQCFCFLLFLLHFTHDLFFYFQIAIFSTTTAQMPRFWMFREMLCTYMKTLKQQRFPI